MVDQSKAADGAAVLTWLAYFLANVSEANEVLKFFGLIVGIGSGIYAWRYYARRIRQIDTNVNSD